MHRKLLTGRRSAAFMKVAIFSITASVLLTTSSYVRRNHRVIVSLHRFLGRFISLDARDVNDYDSEEVSRWHRGSVCSGMRELFVGSQPLFAPCRPGLPPGTATWGKYPYEGPFKYINNSKNPCWYEGGEMRCIPYFFLVGVSKSGTSDLFSRMSLHPSIANSRKEYHWFDRQRYLTSHKFSFYLNQNRKFSRRVGIQVHTRGRTNIITGDASPSYFYDNNEWPKYSGNENCTEPRVILANHLRHLNPDVKIIIVFRHPVQRLYSRYLFDSDLQSGTAFPSPEQFHQFVRDGLAKYRDCFNRWSLRHCLYNKTLWISAHRLRIQENLYPVLLEDWLRIIPRDHILLMLFERYIRDTKRELRRVFNFLGVDAPEEGLLDHMVTSRVKNAGKHYSVGPMLPQTKKLLYDFYRPFMRRLAAMIGHQPLWDE